MKQCPACKTTYTDQTLRFCLADGSVLNDVTDDETTVVRNVGGPFGEKTVEMGRGGQMRVEIPSETPQTSPQTAYRTAAPVSRGSSGNVFKVLMVIIGLGIFGVVAVAAGAFIYFSIKPTEPAANAVNQVTKTAPTPTPAKNDTDELRDQIANLEKLLNEQKKTDRPANIPLKMPEQSKTTVSARVDSPGDGFLALRSLPSSEIGNRITKIPHGASVSIGACGPVVRPVSRTGRWCQASYNGYSGWVFDAYLLY